MKEVDALKVFFLRQNHPMYVSNSSPRILNTPSKGGGEIFFYGPRRAGLESPPQSVSKPKSGSRPFSNLLNLFPPGGDLSCPIV